MNGFLHYAAPSPHFLKSQRGAVCGLASSAVALLVLLLPAFILLLAAIGEYFCAKPAASFSTDLPTTLVLILIPTLAMIALPAIGLLLAAAGIALNKRDCQFALAGLIINVAALTAALWITIT